MPNKQHKSKNNSRPGRGKGGSQTTLVPFSGFFTAILVTGNLAIALSPNSIGSAGNIARLHTIEDAFGKYRFTKFSFRLLLDKALTTAVLDMICGFVPRDAQTAAFTTFAEVAETQLYTFVGQSTTVQPAWVKVPRRALAGMLPWYQTLGGSTGVDLEEQNQGTLYLTNGTGAGSTSLIVEMKGVCEFAAPLDPAVTPVPIPILLRQKKELDERLRLSLAADAEKKAKERNKLMLLLGYQESITVTSEGPIPTKWPLQTSSLLAAQSGSRRQ